MSIAALGTEIVECVRIRTMIEEHGERFLLRVYTPAEIRFCQDRRQSTEYFAAFWAAKEAIFKCLALAGRVSSPWSHAEIEMSKDQPHARLRGPLRERMLELGFGHILLTTAFTRHFATATAIALRGPTPA